MKPTGPTNPYLKELINFLKKEGLEKNAPIWLDLAEKLSKPTRKRVEVNVGKIDKYAKENEVVVVPGKVLGAGNLKKRVIVAAWQFSSQAKEKIEKCKGRVISIYDLVKENPTGRNVKIMVG